MSDGDQSGPADGLSRRRFLRGLLATGAGLAVPAAAGPPATGKRPPGTPEGGAGGLREGPESPAVPHVDAQVHINQVGFRPAEPKRAVIAATGRIHGNRFFVIDDDVTPTIRHQGILTPFDKPLPYAPRYPYHFFAGFDTFTRPGRYRLRLSDGHLSAPFSIGRDVYQRLIPLVLQYFSVQRCGLQHSPLRGPCHLDDGVASGGPRHGQPLDATGGWHDAGDYLKFVETTSYVAAVMLISFDHYQSVFTRDIGPGRLPLLLQHARVGLEWLLRMHPRPDEFYFQVGDEDDHDSWRLPEQDVAARNREWKPRRVHFGIGANLAGRTACAFAIGARVYRPYDRSFAARCLAAARSVYALGLRHPSVVTTRPANFYPEKTWQDDMEWGAIELYKTTGQPQYLAQALEFSLRAGSAHNYTSVYNVHAPAHFALYPHAPRRVQQRLLEYLRADADGVRRHAEANPYGLGTPYVWGTAEAAAGAALTCRVYSLLTGERVYEEVAQWQRDFILGANPFSLCCLIGAGTRYPLFPHHQIANIRGVELTGAVVGGPADRNTFLHEDISLSGAEFSTQLASPAPPADEPNQIGVYHDVVGDYVTNEPANDYTAKFLLLAAFYVASS